MARVPARIINVQSRQKNIQPTQIRLDKILQSPKPKICIKRRLGGIGDVLMSTPVLRTLKKLIPNCYLVYATDMEYSQGALAEVIEHNPYVDELTSFHNINDKEFDYIVDITATGLREEKSGTLPPNRIDMFAEAIGVSVEDDPVPIYEVLEGERDEAQKEIKEKFLQGEKREDLVLIAIQARSNDARRTWPLENVEELCLLLAKNKNFRVLLFDWGHTVERWKESERIFTVLDRKISEVAPLIEQCDLVVCPDSAILHLAGALQKKTVTIFGPIPPICRINHYPNTSAVTLQLPCQYCFYTPRCKKEGGKGMACLTRIEPKRVEEAIMKKLDEPFRTEPNVIHGKDISAGGQDNIILVKRSTRGLGDILMAATGIEAIKKKYPKKKLHVAVHPELFSALEGNPYIDKLEDIGSNFNPRRYYMTYNISNPCARYESTRVRSNRRVEKSRVEIFAEALGTRDLITDLHPRYYVKEEEKEWAKAFLKKQKLKDKPNLIFALTSAEKYRDWPEEKHQDLIDLLNKDFNIILLHHQRKFLFDGATDACGLPLRRSMAILSLCQGAITVDTGTMHIAVALNIPTLSLFGPIDYKARCKGYKNITIMTSNLDCIPCWRNGTMKCQQTGLISGYSKCLESISAKQVARLAKEKLLKA